MRRVPGTLGKSRNERTVPVQNVTDSNRRIILGGRIFWVSVGAEDREKFHDVLRSYFRTHPRPRGRRRRWWRIPRRQRSRSDRNGSFYGGRVQGEMRMQLDLATVQETRSRKTSESTCCIGASDAGVRGTRRAEVGKEG